MNIKKGRLFLMSLGSMMVMFSKNHETLQVNTWQMFIGCLVITYAIYPYFKKE